MRNGGPTFLPIRERVAGPSRECMGMAADAVSYRLHDEPCITLLVACSKCDWKAAFDRDELITTHGSNIGMVELLGMLTAPACSKVGDRCGAYYVNPIDARKGS